MMDRDFYKEAVIISDHIASVDGRSGPDGRWIYLMPCHYYRHREWLLLCGFRPRKSRYAGGCFRW